MGTAREYEGNARTVRNGTAHTLETASLHMFTAVLCVGHMQHLSVTRHVTTGTAIRVKSPDTD